MILARGHLVFALTLVAALGSAAVDVRADEVHLSSEAASDAWCRSARCANGGRRPVEPLADFAPPTSASERGLVEQRLRRELANSLSAIDVVDRTHSARPFRDLLRASASAITDDRSALERSGGVGSAVLRAGLVFDVDSALDPDARCVGRSRLDAIYEGLAASPVGSLGFTEATSSVEAACIETAHAAGHAVASVLAQIVAGDGAPTLRALPALVGEATAQCRVGVFDADALAVDRELALTGARRLVAKLQEKTVRAAETTESDECLRAVEALRAISVVHLDRMIECGLGAARIDDVVSLLAPSSECSAASTCAARSTLRATLSSLTMRRGPSRQQMRALSVSIARRAASAENLTIARVLRALDDAIVETEGNATIDPERFVASLKREYGVGAPRALLGLAASPWSIEINAGIPRLEGGDLRVAGDVELGYESRHASIVGRGGVRYFDFADGVLATDTLDVSSSLTARLSSGEADSPVRFEGGLNAGLDYVDTTTSAQPAAQRSTNFGDYESLLVRASIVAGARARIGERLRLALVASGGGQYESFDSTSVEARGVRFESPDTFSVRVGARFDIRYTIIANVVGARARVETESFTITREEVSFQTGGQAAFTTTSARQLFGTAQVFIDADLLAIAGFVPVIFARIDHVRATSTTVERSTTVPVVGIGVIRGKF